MVLCAIVLTSPLLFTDERIPYHRAVELAVEYGINDILYPLLADNPSEFVSVAATAQQTNIPAPSHL